MTKCVDLKEEFGDKYRVEYEESYYAQYETGARTHDPWYMTIPCDHGHIFPWGDDELAVSLNARGSVMTRLSRIPACVLTQNGDDGPTYVFPLQAFPKVAPIVRPKRKRKLTPEHKAALAASNAKYRFRPASNQELRDEKRNPTRNEGQST